MKTKLIRINLVVLILCLLQNKSYPQTTFTEVAPGIWKCEIGSPEELDFLEVIDVEPNTEALKMLPASEIPIDKSDIFSQIQDRSTYLRFVHQ